MGQFFVSSWRAGFRNRVFFGVFLLGVVLVAVAFLSASFSPRQPKTVALDIGFSGLRISLVLFAISLVQELVSKEIERRTIVLSLSYPVRRVDFVLGRFFGVAALCALAALMLGLLLLVIVFAAGGSYESSFGMLLGVPYWSTIGAIWVDATVVAAFSLCIASLSTVASLPLILGLVFAIAGKALGAVADYLARGADGDALLVRQYSGLVDAIFFLLPDLSRLDWRQWPMYGLAPSDTTLLLSLVMAVGYIGLMIALAVRVLARREFS